MAKVENFSPYLLGLAQRAMVERVTITTPDYGTAKKLQTRFHKLRTAMRREQHPQLPLMERVSTRTSKPGEDTIQHWVVFEPADLDLEELLRKAGIKLDD